MAAARGRDPLLIEVPRAIRTERLLLRVLEPGEGAMVYEAIAESLPELRLWMPWAGSPSVDASESFVRRSTINFHARTELNYGIFDGAGAYVGNIGCHGVRWDIPSFEIGYWCRTSQTGRGYVVEATRALTEGCFSLGAARVEIRTDPANRRSARVAERLGFELEGVLRRATVGVDGLPRDTLVYARLAP